MNKTVLVALGAALLAACASTPPNTSHYRLAVEPDRDAVGPAPTSLGGGVILGVVDLDVDATYDETRMTYRSGAHRLRRYHYHRWGAAPGVLVADALRNGYQQSGAFLLVVRGSEEPAQAVLTGRILRMEEVDVSDSEWRAELSIELRVVDPDSGQVLWSQRLERRRPLDEQSPRGLARAISALLTEIVEDTSHELAAAIAHKDGAQVADSALPLVPRENTSSMTD